MILEREQWHLGYASLLRECRGSSTTNDIGAPEPTTTIGIPSVGRALLIVHPDTDSMATARILSYMLRADGVPYQMRPCLGWERLKIILGKVGVLPPIDHDDDNDNDDEDEDRTNYVENDNNDSTDIRAVVLMNMGANRNLSKLFRHTNAYDMSTQDSFGMSGPLNNNNNNNGGKNIKCYVFDCNRPYHLSNIHAGKNVVLFNDRPFDDEEIVSDGDNLSGNESSTSEEESGDESESDDDEDGGNGRAGRKAGEDSSEGEQEFELEDEEDKAENRGSDSDEEDNNNDEREAKRQKKTRFEDDIDPADDPAQDPEQRGTASGSGGDDLQDSDDDNEGDDYGTKKDSSDNPLDTTAVTADMTMLDETFDTSIQDSQTQEGGSTTGAGTQVTSFRELHRQRRNRIRLHYSSGSYHGSPSAWTAYTLCRQLRFGDTPDLLWLACVGVTDAFLHGRLDVAGYGALTVDLKRHVGRLFPNELVDRVGRAVYAEELEADSNELGGSGGNRAWTQIGLSENGRILSQNEYKFMLLRHTSLWDSLLHSNFVASKFQVWKSSGRQRLMELLAKMGFPLDQCRQPWAFVGPGMKRRLGEKMNDVSEVRDFVEVVICVHYFLHSNLMYGGAIYQEYELGNVSYTGFVRVTGYKSLLSASDMSYAVTALLECSAAAMDGSASKDGDNDDLLDEEDREDREMVAAFNVAFDALNSNGSNTSATGALTTMEGGVEGGDLSNLVNGGNMTGTTGLGAGIRIAMTLQRNIMATARSLVDRNAITRLSHFRYAYLHCSSSGGGSSSGPGATVVTPDPTKNADAARRNNQFHVFAKPLVLTKLAHFLMDMHRENGKWTGTKSRPLVLLAEKPRSNTYMVVGYEYPEDSGDVVKNKFGQYFQDAATSMKGMFWFDSYDTNVVEVAARDVQKFLEQLHYIMEQLV